MTQDNAPSFVPFKQTQAPFGSDPRKFLDLPPGDQINFMASSAVFSYSTTFWRHRPTEGWRICSMVEWCVLSSFSRSRVSYHLPLPRSWFAKWPARNASVSGSPLTSIHVVADLKIHNPVVARRPYPRCWYSGKSYGQRHSSQPYCQWDRSVP